MAPAMPAAPTLATLAGDAALEFEELPEVEVELAEEPPALEVFVEPAPPPVPAPVPDPVPEPELPVAVAAPPDVAAPPVAVAVPAVPLTALPRQLVSDPALMVNGAVWAVRPLLSRTVKLISVPAGSLTIHVKVVLLNVPKSSSACPLGVFPGRTLRK